MRSLHRYLVVGGLLLAALLAVSVRLHALQMSGRTEVLQRPYVDQATLEVMDRLLTQGVLTRGKEGKVLVRLEALRREVASASLRRRIVRVAKAAHLRPGARTFDPRLLSVLPPQRRLAAPLVLRGAILDRRGEPLALSRLSDTGRSQSRVYPLGPMAQQVVGFHHPVFGDQGLEAVLDGYLSKPESRKPYLQPKPGLGGMGQGHDVHLTIDAALQKAAYEALQGRRGSVVILDAATGAIRAAVGLPAFDPNTKKQADWRKARQQDQGRLFSSRAWGRPLPPGSTFKLVVAAAHLEAGGDSPVISCAGRDRSLNIGDHRAHGRMDLDRALIRSCNVYFARLGVSLGPAVPEMARSLGFNQPLDLIPQARDWRLPVEPSLAYAHYRFQPRSGDQGAPVERRLVPFNSFRRDKKIAAQCAIGQNLVAATPLQMAMVAQAVANQGVLRQPYLVAGLGDPRDRSTYEPWAPPTGKAVMSRATAARLRGVMARVMTQGTGRSAPKIVVEGRTLPMAGKSGTAETGVAGQEPHAWFVGFAPANRPRLVVAVVVENGGWGGKVAGPVASAVLQAAFTPATPAPAQTRTVHNTSPRRKQ